MGQYRKLVAAFVGFAIAVFGAFGIGPEDTFLGLDAEAATNLLVTLGALVGLPGVFQLRNDPPPNTTGAGTTLKVQPVALLTAGFLALVALAGCANQITPDTARERLVVAEYTYQGVLDEVEQAARLGLLRGEQAETAAERLATAKTALEALRVATETAGVGDDLDAQRATDAALAALLTYLETTGAIEPLPELEG